METALGTCSRDPRLRFLITYPVSEKRIQLSSVRDGQIPERVLQNILIRARAFSSPPIVRSHRRRHRSRALRTVTLVTAP